ncbi:hypothetical protein N2152v2_011255 [Parachlorella kessleri]
MEHTKSKVVDQLTGKFNAAAEALSGSQGQAGKDDKPLALESAEQAAQHRKERGEEEPLSPRKSALGRHYDIGGVADYGPVDTDRINQPDSRDEPIQARVP